MEGRARTALSTGLLAGLVLAVLLTALSRTPPPPEDATGWLQAASLLLDRDLSFEDSDAARAARWAGARVALYRNAEGVLRFDRPLPHAFLSAPFVILGLRGPLVLNGLLLALTAWLASWALGRQLGWQGPWLVVVFLFGSIAFATVFRQGPSTLLLLSGAGAFALVFGGEILLPWRGRDGKESVGSSVALDALRWLLAGALLGVAVLHHPLYLGLVVAAALAVPKTARALALPALAVGVVAVVLATTAVQRDGGVWLGAPALRGEVTLGAPEDSELGGPSRAVFHELDPKADGALLRWNALYALAGRHVGILVYFLPLLLIPFGGDGVGGRRALLVTGIVTGILFVVLQPFDFSGGGFGNPSFLPVYGALWFMVVRAAAIPLTPVVLALAIPVLLPLWRSPAGPVQLSDGSYRHVSRWVRRYLPLETTQRELFRGSSVLAHGLWVRQLSGAPPGVSEPMLVGSFSGEILVASPNPLSRIRLVFPGTGADELEVAGGKVERVAFRPDGGADFTVALSGSSVSHPMWWGPVVYHLYPLTLSLPGVPEGVHPFTLELAP